MDPYNTADSLGVPARGNALNLTPAASAANPYAAPSARLAEPAMDGEIVLASRMARLGAVLIDSFALVVPAMVIAVALPAMSEPGEGLSTGGTALIAVFGLVILAFCVYQMVMLHRHGQTLGKKLVGVRIVRQDGSRASFGRVIGLRYFVPGLIGAIPLLGPLFSLIDPLFIFGDDKRCLHDRFADTIVVDA
jgi:uncharacterized RDD family membrane protein YckC